MSCAPRRSASSARPCWPTASSPSPSPSAVFGLAHRLAGLAETFARLDAHAFEVFHQRLEVAAQLALAFLQLLQRLGELLGRHALPVLAFALLSLFALAELLLAVLAALALAALHLVHAERLVHHLLLAPHDLAELVHLLAHLALLAALAALLLAAGLQVVHHLLELRQQLLRLVPVARLRQVLDLVHQLFQVALAQFLAGLHLIGEVRVLLRALGEFAQEFVHRLAQLLHELVDFLVAGAALERVLQRLLRLAKPLLGGREVALLDAERDFPEIGDDVAQRVRRSRPS